MKDKEHTKFVLYFWHEELGLDVQVTSLQSFPYTAWSLSGVQLPALGVELLIKPHSPVSSQLYGCYFICKKVSI